MKWRRRFYRFLKKEGAYSAYMRNVKTYWNYYFIASTKRTPGAYVDSVFEWIYVSEGLQYWVDINNKWLSALRRDYSKIERAMKHVKISFNGIPITGFADGGSFKVIPLPEHLVEIGGCLQMNPLTAFDGIKHEAVQALWEQSSPEQILEDMYRAMKMVEDLDTIKIPTLDYPDLMAHNGPFLFEDPIRLEDMLRGVEEPVTKGKKIESLDFNVKGNQPVWFSKKRRN